MALVVAYLVLLVCLAAGASGAPIYCQNALSTHNYFRAKYPIPALIWNATLAAQATAWSKAQISATGCKLSQSTPEQRGYTGENILGLYGSTTPNCSYAAGRFFSKASEYKYGPTPWTTNQPNFQVIGQFTQAVWKSSIQLGCGAAVSQAGCYVVTCRYWPPGNIAGDYYFLNNVLPPKPTTPASPPPPKKPSPPPSPPKPPHPNPPTPYPPGTIFCQDKNLGCAWAKANNYCSYYWTTGGAIKDDCPVSCNACPFPPSPPAKVSPSPPKKVHPPPKVSPSPPKASSKPSPPKAQPPPPKVKSTVCVDTNPNCAWAKANNYCSYYWTTGGTGAVKDSCPVSCGTCPFPPLPPIKGGKPRPPKASPPPPVPSNISSTVCVDKTSACAWAKANNYCSYWWTTGGAVKDSCPVSCGTCPKAGRRLSAADVTMQQPRRNLAAGVRSQLRAVKSISSEGEGRGVSTMKPEDQRFAIDASEGLMLVSGQALVEVQPTP